MTAAAHAHIVVTTISFPFSVSKFLFHFPIPPFHLPSYACMKSLENGKVKLAVGVLTSIKHLGTADNNAKAIFEDYSGSVSRHISACT